MAYAMNQSAAKLPQAERVQTAQAAKGGAADAAKTAQDAGAAFDVKISDAAKKKAADAHPFPARSTAEMERTSKAIR